MTPRRRARLGAATMLCSYALLVFVDAVPSAGRVAENPIARQSFWSRLAQDRAVEQDRATQVAAAATDSQRTVSGAGAYADLKLTVSQTKNLVDQSVAISWKWTGADKHATKNGPGENRANFMQIMQCYGDKAPDRTQCQFGSYSQSDTNSASRQIYPGSLTELKGDARYYLDDADKSITADDADYHSPGSPAESYYVPFVPVTDAKDIVRGVDVVKNPFYGVANTNEIPYASTRADGTGFETFETLTYRESNGLGCGDILTSGPKKGQPRSCWLVVVPRGETEVDGRSYQTTVPVKLQSSPLSATNWANRIVVPLGFAAVGRPCPIGAQQMPVGGVETSTEAVLRWQPALCRGGGSVYSFNQLADSVIENGLIGTDTGEPSRLGLLNRPIDPAAVPGDRVLVYAPIAISGLGVSLLVERQPRADAPPATKARRSERITEVNLTPRLVAKLLTQSYPAGVDPTGARYLLKNPRNIDQDPDFLRFNPEFRQLDQSSLQILLPSGLSQPTDLLWQWIVADQDARDFVAGLPDPWGMTVNPFYQGLDLPQDGFPKLDPYCRRGPVNGFEAPSLCVFDLHPYAQDLHEDARLTARGDALARQWSSPQTDPLPIISKKIDPPQPGGRQLLGFADTPTAARYQLVTAKLRNGAGSFVAPTSAALLAGVQAMLPTGVPGVGVGDPTTTARGAYPLTTITYATAAPNQLTADRARAYARFIRFAVGPGQQPGSAAGNLPAGYAALPAALRARSLKVADQVEARIGPKAQPVHRDPKGGGSKPGPGGGNGGPSIPNPAPSTPAPATSTPPAVAPTPANSLALTARTPGDHRVATRYAFLIALTLGISAAVLGPLLPRLAQRLGL